MPAITDTKTYPQIVQVMFISFIAAIILLAAMIIQVRGVPGLMEFFHHWSTHFSQ